MAPAGQPVDWVRAQLGYEPREPVLFVAALTHRSAASPNNERLEFLGDSVLNLLVSEHLYREFPAADEGQLSRLRARIVSREPLAVIAQSLSLGAALRLGPGELKTGGFRRESILADAFEAVCGAIFLDGGLEAARRALAPLLAPRVAALATAEELKDPKTLLQEYLQSRGLPLPSYVVESVTGEPHDQQFTVSCTLERLGLRASGSGSNRRAAEQQ
ncbi:MAG: ribonuclease III, partial [Steroidobacteraceae bacterium]